MKKGFTLMELLLVVAVLAIVAAAAAPTFFGGAQEAMEEAKKANFMSAYQNTLSGANLMVSIAASQGLIPEANKNLTTANALGTGKSLDDYAPAAARTFDLGNNCTGTLSAQYVIEGNDKAVYVFNGSKKIALEANNNYSYSDIVTLVGTTSSSD